jgi:dTDP-4-amino-4,6-dideoxygalactose transaminase
MARPVLGDEEEQAVIEVLRSGQLSLGPRVPAFEQAFAARLGGDLHASAVSSGTAGLHLALRAAGVGEGDEVITSPFSFIASANAILYERARPVFVDIDPATYNIRPDCIEAALTPRTRAILCVHQMGMPCEIEAIVRLARQRGIRVIEDAACAAGSEIHTAAGWQRIGRPHGDVACFSFHPRKVVTTGDGGMLTTADPEWDRRFRLWRQHGMSVPDVVRHEARTVVFESYPTVGFNYRLTDPQAAIGRKQLERLPDIIERRRRLAARYRGALAHTRFTPPVEPEWARSNWQSYCVRLPERADQREIMQRLLDRGIATRRGIMCTHREPAYADLAARHPLAESERAQDRCMLLPLYAQMTDAEQDRVVDALREAW